MGAEKSVIIPPTILFFTATARRAFHLFMSASSLPVVTIYTDGSCLGNPGAGGWAAILECNGHKKNISGGCAHTTNNRMEMTAIIRALAALKKKSRVQLYTDSQYVADGITKWLPKWQQKQFRKSDGKPVKNVDLWQELNTIQQQHDIRWQWVRGHATCEGNNQADELANAAAHQAARGNTNESITATA